MPYAHEDFLYTIEEEIGDNVLEAKVLVEFYVVPGDEGVDRYSNGDPGYPPESAHIEIVKVTYANTNVEISQVLFDRCVTKMEKEAWNVINSKLKEFV